MKVPTIKPWFVSSIIVGALLVASMLVSGCSSPFSGQAPTVTVSATYSPPTPTPAPTVTIVPSPTPITSWNGNYVKLYGNVNVSSGIVYGCVTINYMDQNYWYENPSATYDTEVGGNYSIENVRANVPFKVTIGYLYIGSMPEIMTMKLINKTYVIENDTRMDFTVMTSNITPIRT